MFRTQQGHSTRLKNTNEAQVQQKSLVIRVKYKLPLPESQHKSVGHDPMLPATMGVQSK